MSFKTIIKQKNKEEIRKIIKSKPTYEIALELEGLEINETLIFLRFLNLKDQSKIFIKFSFKKQCEIINILKDQELKNLLKNLNTSDITKIAQHLPEKDLSEFLTAADKKTKQNVSKILKYDEESTGSLMKIDIILLKKSQTVKQVKTILEEKKDQVNLKHNLFVVNAKKKLLGYVHVKDLLFAKNSDKITNLFKPTGFVTTTTDKEESAKKFAEFDMTALPVINSTKEVVGMITSDDIIDVVIEEATEDFHKSVGIVETKTEFLYSESNTTTLFKSRTLWLMLLMISATLSQIFLDTFQNFSHKILVEVFLTTSIIAILPVISSVAGNAGSQSSTTVIRALSVGNISTKNYLLVFWKEFKASILIGLFLAVINFLRLIIYYWIKEDLDYKFLFLSLGASISLFVVIILAKLIGGLLPLLVKSLNFDPAVMATPILTTIVDALSIIIFFAISIGILVLII